MARPRKEGVLRMLVGAAARDLRTALRRPPADADEVRRHARDLVADGITVVPAHFDTDVCTAAYDAVKALVEAHPDGARLDEGAFVEVRDATGERGWDSGMVDVHDVDRVVPEARTLRDDPFLRDVVRTASGRPLEPVKVNAYVNRGVGRTRGFHVDSLVATQYKALIYLTDVTDVAHGPYAYVRGSHRFNLDKYRNVLKNRKEPGAPMTDMPIHDAAREDAVLGPRGCVALSDQGGFHRGLPQAPDKERVVLVVQYVDQRRDRSRR